MITFRMMMLTLLAGFALGIAPAESQTTLPQLSVPSSVQCTEGGTVNIPAIRSGSTATTAQFSYRTSNGTATAGEDFRAASGNQSVRIGARTYTIKIYCQPNDTRYEGPETFNFSVAARNGTATVTNAVTTVTVLDDDPAPPSVQKPTLVTPPELRGDVVLPTTLNVSAGVWKDAVNFFYVWSRDRAEIVGEKLPQYAATDLDLGKVIRAGVVACNVAGCTYAESDGRGPIVAPAPDPTPEPTPEPQPLPVVVPTGWSAFPLTEPNRGLHRSIFALALESCPALNPAWGPALVKGNVYRVVGFGVERRSDGSYQDHWSVVFPEGAALTATNMSTVDDDCLAGLYKGEPPLPWTAR